MKKFTKRFLKTIPKDNGRDDTDKNSEDAFTKLGIPKALWKNLTEKSANSNLVNSLLASPGGIRRSLFMAGVAVGWAEANKKIK